MRSLRLVLLLLAIPLVSYGQDFESLLRGPFPEGAPPQQFGSQVSTLLVPIQSFVPISNAGVYTSNTQGYHFGIVGQSDVSMWAPLAVDVGVSVEEVCMEFLDNDDLEQAILVLIGAESGSAANPTPAAIGLASVSTGGPAMPGYVNLCVVPTAPGFTFPLRTRTVGNISGGGGDTTIQYYLLVALPATQAAGTVGHGAAVIKFRRLVPEAVTATFADVPIGHPQHRFVEALFASGITAGCGGGNFCPTTPVTRGQLAVFLAAALGLYFPN